MNILSSKLNPIEKYLESDKCDDDYKECLGGWSAEAREEIERIKKVLEKFSTKFEQLLKDFGEPPAARPESFFMNLKKISDYVKVFNYSYISYLILAMSN